MTKTNVLLILIVLIIFTGITTEGQNKNSSNEIIQLEISADKSCYSLQEEIQVLIKFKNVGNTSVYLYQKEAHDYLDGLKVLIYNSEGKLIREEDTKGFDVWLIPNPEDFIKLEPGESINRELTLILNTYGSKKKGIYFLRGYYQSPVSNRKIPNSLDKQKIWTLQDNDIYSSKLKIMAVTKCKDKN